MCVFWASASWLCFKVSFCLFGQTRNASVTSEKAKFVGITYMQQQNVEFTSIQMCFRGVDIAILN